MLLPSTFKAFDLFINFEGKCQTWSGSVDVDNLWRGLNAVLTIIK